MAITVSPSVQVREFDLTTIIPAVSQTPGAIAGLFHWGPVGTRVLLDSEVTLKQTFGGPDDFNAETWFTTANFLGYGGACQVVRAGSVSGNTVTLSTITASNANSTFVGTTTGLTSNMVLLADSNNVIINPTANGKVTVGTVSATNFILSSSATGSGSLASMTFRDDVLYSAVAQETPDVTINWQDQTVNNPTDYLNKDGTFASSVKYVARYPGADGDSLRIAEVDNATSYHSNTALVANSQINSTATFLTAVSGSSNVVITVTPTDTTNAGNVSAANTIASAAQASLSAGDMLELGNTTVGVEYGSVANVGSVINTGNVFTITVSLESAFGRSSNCAINYVSRYWEFFNLIQTAPGQSEYVAQFGNTAANDELHVVVVDEGGKFTGVPGTVLEVYNSLSRAKDALLPGNQSNYYKNVINQDSQYIWWANDRTSAPSANAAFIASSTATAPMDVNFYGGSDGLDESKVSLGTITKGYDLFASAEDVDIGLVMQGKARGISVSSNTNLATYLINNIAETRKDCVVFSSPDKPLVVNNIGYEASSIVTARNAMPSSSYAVMDSGYKYQYDKYNDIWRWIPLNGDIAGLCARTDQTNDPWWSPAGFSRGNIKNVGKLAWNPSHQSQRDQLYAVGVNSVVSFPTLGTVLYGDKTLLGRPSAFDRINVRRLFITLEKAIATAAKFTLFEFNDAFTRSQFRAMVNPYLADVMSKRGIQDFVVVCDATNNTPVVIDANQFKAALYIKPARSINWIILDFVAVPTGVQFSEVIGQYGG